MAQRDTIRLQATGPAILNNPLWNKGTAFDLQERDALGLHGLLPSHVSTVEEQIDRSYQNFCRKSSPLAKYNFLIGLLSRNELLFYQLVAKHAAEMLPIIYTPTVGEAAVHYSSIYFRQRGLYLSYPLKDKMDEIFRNCPVDEAKVIVATDGERILGLGDQGIGGMTISVGKLALYTLFGGIHPAHTLPILLDVGTNNEALLKDPLYLGWRHPRISGADYDDFIERFVHAVKKRYPKVLLQWEDFGRQNAKRLLDRYRKAILSFNDDIEGTGAVTLAALFAAVKVKGEKLSDQQVVLLGGGSAGTGIADILVKAMAEEGLSEEEACGRIYIVDVGGLLHSKSKTIYDTQRPYVKPFSALAQWKCADPSHISLSEVVSHLHPTILIGVSAQGGAFTREILGEMARHVKRPIVFPLSNPTSKAECAPQDLIEWTQGKAIVATGSPFPPVEYKDGTHAIGQCNNVYIFPGVGLGALAAEASHLTDAVFLEAARTLASCSPALKDPKQSLFPAIDQVRSVSQKIALAVGKKLREENLSSLSVSKIEQRIDELVWEPHYPTYTGPFTKSSSSSSRSRS